MATHERAHPLHERGVKSGARSKQGKSPVNEIVANMDLAAMHTRIIGLFPATFKCKINSGLGHLLFGAIGVASNESNAPAIAFAAVEFHRLIGLSGVPSERG